MMSKKPKPIVTAEVCDQCGLDWSRHGDSPTLKTCIDLLRADVGKPCEHWTRQTPQWSYTNAADVPHIGPSYFGTGATSTGFTPTQVLNVAFDNLRDDDEPPDAVAAVA